MQRQGPPGQALVIVPAALGALYGWAIFATTFRHPGAIGLDYIAPGTDWMALYGAIRLALDGGFGLTLDGVGFTRYLNATFADWLPRPLFHRPWVYPPSFLVLLAPFGLMGFAAAYAAFQAATAALLAGALRDGRNRGWIVAAALLCPAASVNVVDGQCGFLVAGLLVLGARLLARRSVLAGCVFGLLSVKPQFGLMVPAVLLAARAWPAIGGAAASALALAGASAWLFGIETWQGWIGQTLAAYGDAGSDWANFGRMWGSSVHACAVLLGLPPGAASIAQAAAVAGSAVVVYRTWRSARPDGVKLAVLLAATLLAAPHSSTYDAVLLVIAGGLWLEGLAAPALLDGIVMLILWLAPLLGPPAIAPLARVLPGMIGLFIALALRSPQRQRA